MSYRLIEDLEVVETLKKVSIRYINESIFDIDPDEEPEKWAENHRIQDALDFARDYLKDAFQEKKHGAVMVNDRLAIADTNGYADELADVIKKRRLLDVTCPVCGAVSRAVETNDLRRTIFCWKCGQPMRANYEAMHRGLSQRSRAQKGAGNE